MVVMDSELYHAALNIMRTRDAQLGVLADDELMHYGRKGMKWGEDIYGDESQKRQTTGRDQYAKYLEAEKRARERNFARGMKEKYGGSDQHYDTGNGALIRAQQKTGREYALKKQQNEAIAKYGGPKYTYTPSVEEANAYRSQQERANGAAVREAQRANREAAATYGAKYGGQEQHYDTGNGAEIRARQKAIRDAQAKYGGGSNSDYANQQMAENVERRRNAEAAANTYGAKYGGQDQHYDTGNGAYIREQQKALREAQEGNKYITSQAKAYKENLEKAYDDYAPDGSHAVVGPSGRVIGYADENTDRYYDVSQKPGTVAYPGTQPVFDERGRQTGVMDENGNYASNVETAVANAARQNALWKKQQALRSKK